MLTFLSDEIIEYCMRAAMDEAKSGAREITVSGSGVDPNAAPADDIPVGCTIADGQGNIIAKARNTREISHLVTGHAEITALNKAAELLGDYRLNGYYVFVTLEPCPMCAGAIAAARPEAVFYGAPNTVNGACGTVYNLLYPRVKVYGGIMEKESSELISSFFKAIRK